MWMKEFALKPLFRINLQLLQNDIVEVAWMPKIVAFLWWGFGIADLNHQIEQ
jgi:hypothetical protein